MTGLASRSRLIVLLLLLVTILVLGLVWQSIETARSNRDTAAGVLRDYAQLAGDEFVRRAMAEIGYYGYYTHINTLTRQLAAGADIFKDPVGTDADDAARKAALLARYRFYVERAGGGLRLPYRLEQNVQDYLARRAGEVLLGPAPESGLIIDHVLLGAEAHTFVFAKADGRVVGFEVDYGQLANRLGEVFAGEPLLPASLADGTVGNESLFLAVSKVGGKTLFETNRDYDPYLITTTIIGDDYSGIFAKHSVSTAIDAGAADALVIGGLPQSRLPLLLATVALTVTLLVTALLQLRREYALMKMRGDFVSEVSHELRTPLTQIRMFTETLLLERLDTSDDKRRALEIINRESQRLSNLVENVLRFSGRNSDGVSLSVLKGKLAPVVERVAEEFRPLAAAAGATIEWKLDNDAEAEFDNDALRRILLNLLDNAVKYGPEGQRINVVLEQTATAVRLAVADQGPGVPAADREKIWNAYHRLERERESAIAGTGIGLAVVRDLVAAMGGTSRAESGDDGGATFIVELPGTARS